MILYSSFDRRDQSTIKEHLATDIQIIQCKTVFIEMHKQKHVLACFQNYTTFSGMSESDWVLNAIK